MSSYHSQEQMLAQLPEPSVLEIKHSSELIELIVSDIEHNGAMSFYDYMNRILYEPGLGYYSAGTAKFGAAGDFITAPEISPLFGQCLRINVSQYSHRGVLTSCLNLVLAVDDYVNKFCRV